jgi:hypothetical protein
MPLVMLHANLTRVNKKHFEHVTTIVCAFLRGTSSTSTTPTITVVILQYDQQLYVFHVFWCVQN